MKYGQLKLKYHFVFTDGNAAVVCKAKKSNGTIEVWCHYITERKLGTFPVAEEMSNGGIAAVFDEDGKMVFTTPHEGPAYQPTEVGKSRKAIKRKSV